MADTPKRILPAQLQTADAALFTVPSGETWIISEIVVLNTDTVQRTVKFHHTNGATASAAANALMWDTPVQASQVVGMGRGWAFEADDKLRASSDANSKVTVTIYYVARTT
jgi:hypothetical protein